jgi:hypothetical protein
LRAVSVVGELVGCGSSGVCGALYDVWKFVHVASVIVWLGAGTTLPKREQIVVR